MRLTKDNNIIAFDIETNVLNNVHRVSSMAFLDYKKLIILKQNSIIKFLFLLYKSRCNSAYAHNFSSFDSYFIAKALIILKFKIKKIYIRNNCIYFLEAEIRFKKIYFRDSYLLFPQKLSEIIFTLTGFNKKFIVSESITKRYLLYTVFDVIFLYYILKSSIFLCNVYKINMLSCVSSTQFIYSVFLKTLKVKFVLLLRYIKNYYVQAGYSGGFVDIMDSYGKNIYYYDINSLYPYMMLKAIPWESCDWVEGDFNLKNFFGFLGVTFTEKPYHIPLLTKRFKKTTILFSEELKFLEKLGYKYTILNYLKFNIGKDIFKKVVRHFYLLKKDKDVYMSTVSKNLLNSLYGRFALKIKIENSNYVSASVSSYARIEIFQYKLLQHYIYSDTDSIFIFNKLNKKYVGEQIGVLKLKEFIDHIYILKEKTYYYKIKKRYTYKASGLYKYLIEDHSIFNKLALSIKRRKNFNLTLWETSYTSRSNVIKKKYLPKVISSFFDFLFFLH